MGNQGLVRKFPENVLRFSQCKPPAAVPRAKWWLLVWLVKHKLDTQCDEAAQPRTEGLGYSVFSLNPTRGERTNVVTFVGLFPWRPVMRPAVKIHFYLIFPTLATLQSLSFEEFQPWGTVPSIEILWLAADPCALFIGLGSMISLQRFNSAKPKSKEENWSPALAQGRRPRSVRLS